VNSDAPEEVSFILLLDMAVQRRCV